MNKSHLKSNKTIPYLWGGLFLGVSLLVALMSFFYEIHSARSAVEQYVGIWEDDIARAKIFQGDPTLQNKILQQLKQVHQAVMVTEVQAPERLQCLFSTDVPITYNSLPAGSVRICFAGAELFLKSLLSPVFVVGILLALLFLGFGVRREFLSRLHEQQLQAELALNKELSAMSRQVAHDIRGPLTALTTLSQLSHEMSVEKKELLELAVARIRGIADDLLKKGRSENPQVVPSVPAQGPDLSMVINSLLKEYRFSHPDVEFVWHNHISSQKAVVPLEALKLQRVISNLLNNSLEARPENEAAIHITLLERQSHWLVQIMDNGGGIPEKVLPTLTQEGVSYGKEQGHGLGLYDARKTMESIGGELQLRSRQGIGTQVVLLFPKSVETLSQSS